MMNQEFYKLMLVTNRQDMPFADYLQFIRQCANAGITSVQLREKQQTQAFLLMFGQELKSILNPLNIPLIINDDFELAIELDAAGVHLGQTGYDTLSKKTTEVDIMFHDLEKVLTQLRITKPLVLCLTNQVTMDFMANCLLSLGAAPIMTQDIREMEELVQISHAINLNIGTLDAAFIERAELAAQLAAQYNKPIILDPVGAGATFVRTDSARSLMLSANIIRGNASEIMALLENIDKSLGVESTHLVSDATHSATLLAKNHQCTVVVSGEQDFVTDGQQGERFAFGSSLMPLVTGMGCATLLNLI